MAQTVVELQRRPRDRVRIRLSGGRFFTVPAAEAAALAVGTALDERAVRRLDRVDQYFRGKEKALRLLAGRARTREELRRALAGIDVAPSVREGILDELEEAGLVDDARFAEEYIEVKAAARRYGPHRLRHDLGRLGVRRGVIEAALSRAFDADRQEALAREEARRRIGSGPVDERAVRRVAGALRRKGFDYEIVNRVAYDLLRRSGAEAPDDAP